MIEDTVHRLARQGGIRCVSGAGTTGDVVKRSLPIHHPASASGDAAPSPDEPVRPTTAHRQRWAVETMAVASGDTVLEIGCGRGAAVSLVASRLTTGRIVAIDRAATMVRLATKRNIAHINAGRADIRRVGFESADLDSLRFDKIFAVNVSMFWLGDATQQIERMRSLLTPGGRLYVFGERPTAAHATANVTSTTLLLEDHGFATTTASATRGKGQVLTCVSGTPIG
ncbi:class I SAM-dependent methyltransferase [Micromonospora sp. LAH09]|uniref:class I SAM-dependent methyltransferase n=1 Tax=Micromonospora cabrerizensis TaxID=2911213 RepID=UPI001EE92B07|nr:class I SAM-dependent methyltransferase [Micromonospora cabrerizensis]MCG5471964.1 class I SAM-dependent methyltransferase [Micromonospora cabrerizensis]